MTMILYWLIASASMGELHFTLQCGLPRNISGFYKGYSVDIDFHWVPHDSHYHANWKYKTLAEKKRLNPLLLHFFDNTRPYVTCDKFKVTCSHKILPCLKAKKM